jgi:nitrate reductase gamma subunit
MKSIFLRKNAPQFARLAAGVVGVFTSTGAMAQDAALEPDAVPWITYSILGAIVLVILAALNEIMKARKIMADMGMSGGPGKKTNYTEVLAMFLAGCVAVGLGIKSGMEAGNETLSLLLFIALPYTALTLFFVGSIYRYIYRGFQVSSLSSQFLERKKLFWGSQLFHWGMLIIFFGHLIAFAVPSSILLWNGHPLRLLILELSSFAFGLASLVGLILFIRRRLTSSKISVVSNKMDMLVYAVLLVQILSGLGIAFFSRWGSSWFAGVMTPYLRSIFSFDPQIAAVNAMPWYVQVHIVFAFFIIGLIPFTRFMHFLVAPVDYLWRRYQLVIWNWNNEVIRTSTSMHPGKKSMNH